MIGRPDLGLMTMTEMAEHAANIAGSVSLPVLADADTGYGGVLNVIRTVQTYERGGVGGIQLEDQVVPKRCGHVSGKRLVSVEDFAAAVRAAADARRDPDFVIVARTDARAPEGLESAIRRANAYVAAGADMIFVEAPRSEDEIAQIRSSIDGPVMVNMVPVSATPFLMPEVLTEMGIDLAIYPGITLGGAYRGIERSLSRLRDRTIADHIDEEPTLADILELGDFDSWSQLEAQYLGTEPAAPVWDRDPAGATP